MTAATFRGDSLFMHLWKPNCVLNVTLSYGKIDLERKNNITLISIDISIKIYKKAPRFIDKYFVYKFQLDIL